jgi:hypothetical protein
VRQVVTVHWAQLGRLNRGHSHRFASQRDKLNFIRCPVMMDMHYGTDIAGSHSIFGNVLR